MTRPVRIGNVAPPPPGKQWGTGRPHWQQVQDFLGYLIPAEQGAEGYLPINTLDHLAVRDILIRTKSLEILRSYLDWVSRCEAGEFISLAAVYGTQEILLWLLENQGASYNYAAEPFCDIEDIIKWSPLTRLPQVMQTLTDYFHKAYPQKTIDEMLELCTFPPSSQRWKDLLEMRYKTVEKKFHCNEQ